jgi:hypothetical protein
MYLRFYAPLALLVLAATPASPFGISPVGQSNATLKSVHHRWYEQVASPVHEKFRFLAISGGLGVSRA